VLFCLIIATLYLGIGDDFSSQNHYNIAGLLFMWSSLPGFGAVAFVPTLVLGIDNASHSTLVYFALCLFSERELFYRERNDGLYRVITYLVAKLLDEIVISLILSLIFAVLVYYLTDLQLSFLIFWVVYWGCLLNGIGKSSSRNASDCLLQCWHTSSARCLPTWTLLMLHVRLM